MLSRGVLAPDATSSNSGEPGGHAGLMKDFFHSNQSRGKRERVRSSMTRYTLRAVSRDVDGRVTNIADWWPLTSISIEEARIEADRQKWEQRRDLANAFEIIDASGGVVTWRRFREAGEEPVWS